jgi:uncharacterized protein (TIGR02452 family)
MNSLLLLAPLDSDERAARCRQVLQIPQEHAAELGRTAVAAAETGAYRNAAGRLVDWRDLVAQARTAKRCLPPDAELPEAGPARFSQTRVQVANETTLAAARRLTDTGEPVLALNFANGIHPGGGFLGGARAQEEVLCHSSALYATLEGDPMYAAHRKRPLPDSTDWAILSPDVPVFRNDEGTALDAPWSLGFLTCAAPYAPALGQLHAGDLLQARIRRVLAIARPMAIRRSSWGPGAAAPSPTIPGAPHAASKPRSASRPGASPSRRAVFLGRPASAFPRSHQGEPNETALALPPPARRHRERGFSAL